MNYENINNVIYEIQQLQKRGFNITLNPETIISDFESLNEAKCKGRRILPSEYRFVKTLQTDVYTNLANVTESQINEFVPLSIAIEMIRLELSQDYETRKLISGRVRKLKSFVGNMCDYNDEEVNTRNASISNASVFDASVFYINISDASV